MRPIRAEEGIRQTTISISVSSSSLTTGNYIISNTNACVAITPVVFQVERPGLFQIITPHNPSSVARGIMYRMKKTATGYTMKTYFHDTSASDYQDAIMETRHAMDIGVFMTEFREIEVFMRKPAKLTTTQLLPSGAELPYHLKISMSLPLQIQAKVAKRKKINDKMGIYAGGKRGWITLEENAGDLCFGR
jgi:hypothetical protein